LSRLSGGTFFLLVPKSKRNIQSFDPVNIGHGQKKRVFDSRTRLAVVNNPEGLGESVILDFVFFLYSNSLSVSDVRIEDLKQHFSFSVRRGNTKIGLLIEFKCLASPVRHFFL